MGNRRNLLRNADRQNPMASKELKRPKTPNKNKPYQQFTALKHKQAISLIPTSHTLTKPTNPNVPLINVAFLRKILISLRRQLYLHNRLQPKQPFPNTKKTITV
jgi:hypothetical protein